MSTEEGAGEAYFSHERLDVYRLALDVVARAVELSRRIPPRDESFRSQFLRAVTSITFNTAEGATELSRGDKIRFYRMARRSTGEVSSVLDVLHRLGHVTAAEVAELKQSLNRISAMLLALINRLGGGHPPT
ncbi:MAG: four helix bundle protein [Longimicrobiales bacterium]